MRLKVVGFKKSKFFVYFSQLSTKAVSQVLGLILNILIVRICGVEINGLHGATLAISNLTFAVVAGSIQTNFLKNGKTENYLLAIQCTFIIAFILFIPILIIAYLIDYEVPLVGLAFVQILFISLLNLFVAYKRLQGKDFDILLPSILPYLIIIIFICSFRPNKIFELLLLINIGWTIILPFLFKDVKISIYGLNKPVIKKFIFTSLIIASSGVFTQIFANIDVLFIKHYLGDSYTGTYRIAVSFSSIVMPAIGIFSFIYLSEIAKVINQNNKRLLRLKFKRQLLLNFILCSIFCIFSFFLNPFLLPFIYGEKASGAVTTSIICSIGILLNSIAMVFSYTLLGLSKEKVLIGISAIGAVVNILANSIFIPKYGIIGGALGTIATFLIIILYCIFYFLNNKYLLINKELN